MNPECPCPKGIRPLGRLYGVNMGEGLVRLSTDRTCGVHNDHARDGWPCMSCGAGDNAAWIHPEERRLPLGTRTNPDAPMLPPAADMG